MAGGRVCIAISSCKSADEQTLPLPLRYLKGPKSSLFSRLKDTTEVGKIVSVGRKSSVNDLMQIALYYHLVSPSDFREFGRYNALRNSFTHADRGKVRDVDPVEAGRALVRLSREINTATSDLVTPPPLKPIFLQPLKDGRKYTDPQDLFSVVVPQAWTEGRDDRGYIHFAKSADGPGIIIMVNDITGLYPDVTRVSYPEMIKQLGLEDSFGKLLDFVLIDRVVAARLDSDSTAQISVQYPGCRATCLLIIHQRSLHMLIFFAKSRAFGSYAAVFESIVQSYQLG